MIGVKAGVGYLSYKGVTKDPSREGCPWKVNAPYRTRDGKLKYFNTYRSTAEEAARVYDDYIRKCYPDRQ